MAKVQQNAVCLKLPTFWTNQPKAIVIVNTLNSPSYLRQETAKGPFGLRVKLPVLSAFLSITHGGGFILFL